MEGDQLSVIKKEMLDVTLNQSEGITESSYEETTDNMINKVAIYNSKNKKIGTVSYQKLDQHIWNISGFFIC